MSKISPLAPERFPVMPPLAGVRLSTAAAGIRYKGRTDVLLVELGPGTTVAGVLTKSKTASAPVGWCRTALQGGVARALVVNSGNANAFTGRRGEDAVSQTAAAAVALMNCPATSIFTASTGVIGQPLPVEILTGALAKLKKNLDASAWEAAAGAIMTTDTFPKGATRTAALDGATVTINGIAKGSGMIAPDMATMLSFVFTDAAIPAKVLQELLRPAADQSFNAITIDSDTSTSDTLLLFATGQGPAHDPVTDAADPRLDGFRAELTDLLMDLAHQVVRDGEGATKFVTVTVTGAENARAAKVIALSIANSPLVKTAIAGEDANWGRIVMAVGKAGEAADRDRLAIVIGGTLIAERGEAVEGYDETPVAAHMKGENIVIEVDVGVGNGQFTVWTCDLTHGYIDINADYRS
ncbi:MAG: bifunctional glutamate N-acetyltransferase/amino-acid acetyltransferase ArgJ [Rhodospirillales bacterium]|nr:bifunctional glutamate N-acetyltransferase/amino-acid acetyltransferase ArgJ [Rhodospirillales bacterium]